MTTAKTTPLPCEPSVPKSVSIDWLGAKCDAVLVPPGMSVGEAVRALETYAQLLAACQAAERCLESLERNEAPILRALHKADPGMDCAAMSTFAGWRRNLAHARAAIKAVEAGE